MWNSMVRWLIDKLLSAIMSVLVRDIFSLEANKSKLYTLGIAMVAAILGWIGHQPAWMIFLLAMISGAAVVIIIGAARAINNDAKPQPPSAASSPHKTTEIQRNISGTNQGIVITNTGDVHSYFVNKDNTYHALGVMAMNGRPKVVLQCVRRGIRDYYLVAKVLDGQATGVQLERVECNGHYLTSVPINYADRDSCHPVLLSRVIKSEWNERDITETTDAWNSFALDVWLEKKPQVEADQRTPIEKMSDALRDISSHQLRVELAVLYRDLAGTRYRSIHGIVWRPVFGITEIVPVRIELGSPH